MARKITAFITFFDTEEVEDPGWALTTMLSYGNKHGDWHYTVESMQVEEVECAYGEENDWKHLVGERTDYEIYCENCGNWVDVEE